MMITQTPELQIFVTACKKVDSIIHLKDLRHVWLASALVPRTHPSLGLGNKNCSHQLFCRLDKLVSKCVHHGDPIIFSLKFLHFY